MANKRAKQRKPKQNLSSKPSGQKGGMMTQDMSSPKPMKKKK